MHNYFVGVRGNEKKIFETQRGLLQYTANNNRQIKITQSNMTDKVSSIKK